MCMRFICIWRFADAGVLSFLSSISYSAVSGYLIFYNLNWIKAARLLQVYLQHLISLFRKQNFVTKTNLYANINDVKIHMLFFFICDGLRGHHHISRVRNCELKNS